MAELSVIGTSHQTAPVEVREGLALASDEAARVLAGIRAETVFDEALLLSTCNRTEVYFVPRTDADPLAYFLGHVARVKGVRPPDEADIFYRHDDADAVRHLFRVAASLDSQIVGEHEVLPSEHPPGVGRLGVDHPVAVEEHHAILRFRCVLCHGAVL